MSHHTSPAPAAQQDRILSINWRLLGRRLRARTGQLFTSARYRAAQTEYIPPSWMTRLRLTWFRMGLIGVAVFVFTQKQIDFTVTVGAGADPARATSTEGSEPATQTFSLLSTGEPSVAAAEKVWTVADYDEAVVRAYVDRFARVARTEEEKFAIPAPAKMAMAIVESNAGQRPEALKQHNHFPESNAANRYDNAWTSWRTHSQMIDRRFPELADNAVNYQQWISALEKTGYSRDPRYGQKLKAVIDHFGLDDL